MFDSEVKDSLLREALRRGQAVRLRCASGSMAPRVWPGDVLVVCREELRVGDLALVVDGGRLVAHRVLAERARRWRIGIHAGPSGAKWFEGDQILGRVVVIERDARALLWRLAYRLRRVLLRGAAAYKQKAKV